ncbi:MAG: hypothetical protein P8Q40_00695 [Candidatus Poseidonia sp.]|uniref:hypothetical protein n=1 Tax=Poseidonia sp. TaxID=2666344 RepID=UPI0030C47D90|nr:hypothetical protein [Poseidonia sp.]MDG1552579.1 hypothetical protein [Poseidonia sp.]
MKRYGKGGPSLDDVLSEGFSELKIGEENIVAKTSDESVVEEPSNVSNSIDYGKKIQAKEDRESFVVTAPVVKPSAKEGKPSQSDDKKQDILKTPTSQLGDDFDVEW